MESAMRLTSNCVRLTFPQLHHVPVFAVSSAELESQLGQRGLVFKDNIAKGLWRDGVASNMKSFVELNLDGHGNKVSLGRLRH